MYEHSHKSGDFTRSMGITADCGILIKLCILSILPILLIDSVSVAGQPVIVVEDFEFAVTDSAASAGVTDITDIENLPTFYINGVGVTEGGASQGLYALGTDAEFGASGEFVAGTFIGCRREISTELFPSGVVNLEHAYGDPNVAGPLPADLPLGELTILADMYGGEGFGEGLLGTHLWINLIDLEGERFNFVNYSEFALFLEDYTLDVVVGVGLARIDPDSLIEVPNGDRLLTEIAAFEMLIQDEDDPPTGFGKWYIDYLRIMEPAVANVPGDADGDGDVDLADAALLVACLGEGDVSSAPSCAPVDLVRDNKVDLADFGELQGLFASGF
jgi:hypothetical protein